MNPNLKQCIQICRDNYELAMSNITNSIKYLDENDFFMADIHISGVNTYSVTCEESFTEMPLIQKDPLKRHHDDFIRFTGLILSLLVLL